MSSSGAKKSELQKRLHDIKDVTSNTDFTVIKVIIDTMHISYQDQEGDHGYLQLTWTSDITKESRTTWIFVIKVMMDAKGSTLIKATMHIMESPKSVTNALTVITHIANIVIIRNSLLQITVNPEPSRIRNKRVWIHNAECSGIGTFGHLSLIVGGQMCRHRVLGRGLVHSYRHCWWSAPRPFNTQQFSCRPFIVLL